MSWNHRIMRRVGKDGEPYYGIHEVYYDKNDKVEGYTENAVAPFGETEEELRRDVRRMEEAFRLPALDYDES